MPKKHDADEVDDAASERKKAKKEKRAAADLEAAEETAAERKRLKKEKKAAAEAADIEAAEDDVSEKKKLKKEKKAAAATQEELAETAEDALSAKKKLKKEKKAAAEAEAAQAEAAEEAAAAERKTRKKEKKAAALAKAVPASKGDDQDTAIAPQAKRKKPADDDDDDDDFVVKSAKGGTTETAADSGKGGCVFVGGLPSHVDEAYIKRDFAECGTITNVLLSRWPEDGSSKGIAFITFATDAAVKKCIEWNGEYYERKKIRVERKESTDKKVDVGLGGQRGHKPPGCKTVAVLQMSKETTEDDLWSLFEDCGTITLVKVLKHRETHESRGIGFVTFDDTSCTEKAVKLNGKLVNGKNVKVQYAAPKNDRDESGKGGGKGDVGASGQQKKKPDGCMSVVVKNLAPLVVEDDLWRILKSCKSANNVSILVDKDTGESKGMAFIDFDDTNDTDIAVTLSGTELYGKPITVNYKFIVPWAKF